MLLKVISKSDLSHFSATSGASDHEMSKWLLLHFLENTLDFFHDIWASRNDFSVIS